MASKSSSPGPISTTAPLSKQATSRKTVAQTSGERGKAGSAGGIVLDKEASTKTPLPKANSKSSTKSAGTGSTAESTTAANRPRRKPRKLNQDSSFASTNQSTANLPRSTTVANSAAAAELDALKTRVRGLEAKVEELYKSSSDTRSTRSPRRRGKGRKGSSSKEVPTISSTSNSEARLEEVEDEAEEAEDELVRLETELDSARRDLELYRPRDWRTRSGDTEDVEEIPRENIGPAGRSQNNRQVTLSGSYRIPMPANVSVEDVKTIQSGVSAAQNVARSFLEQRRAAAALRAEQTPSPPSTKTSRPKAKSTNLSLEVGLDNGEGKQSWGEWIGGYSMAISRAVSKIEHEAVMESQKADLGPAAPGMSKTSTKRPPAKAKLSSEQVHGLMS